MLTIDIRHVGNGNAVLVTVNNSVALYDLQLLSEVSSGLSPEVRATTDTNDRRPNEPYSYLKKMTDFSAFGITHSWF